MRRASASTKGNPLTIRRLWAAGIGWARISFLAPERPDCPATRALSQAWYQYRHKETANQYQFAIDSPKCFVLCSLDAIEVATAVKNWLMDWPYVANLLAIQEAIVKLMAISDHDFGC
jgi:hypothetical protein